MTYRRALVLILAVLVPVLAAAPGRGLAAPEGQVIWGVHVSLAPIWFDPADTIGMQQLVLDKAVYAPIWELAFLNGVGPRVQESGLGLISGHAYSAPYEDVTLKGK